MVDDLSGSLQHFLEPWEGGKEFMVLWWMFGKKGQSKQLGWPKSS